MSNRDYNYPNVPTYDINDLEKKSPEELDALLAQMEQLNA